MARKVKNHGKIIEEVFGKILDWRIGFEEVQSYERQTRGFARMSNVEDWLMKNDAKVREATDGKSAEMVIRQMYLSME